MKIYIDPEQSPSSILNTFFQVKDDALEFVFPEHTMFFDDPNNIALLKNQALATKKDVSLIVHNPDHHQLLVQMGIPVAMAYKEPLSRRLEEKEFMHPVAPDEGPFFQRIQNELGDEPNDEFTKRYFDLGIPKGGKKQVESSFTTPQESPEEVNPINIHREETITQEAPDQLSFLAQSLLEDAKPIEEKLDEDFAKAANASKKVLYLRIGIAVFVLSAVVWGYFELPRATLKVYAQREKISFSLDVSGDKLATGIDLEKHSIPVQVVQISKSLNNTFTAKTQGNFESKTRGTVTIYNFFAHPQAMIPSRLQSLAGQTYWSQRNIKIPAATTSQGKTEPGRLTIEIIADQKGDGFNLDCSQTSPCRFTVPAWKGSENYTKIYAKATAPIQGGGSGQGYLVSDDEYQKAEAMLRERLLQEGQKSLSASIPSGFTLLENTLNSEISNLSSSPKVGGLSKDGNASIKGDILIRAFLIKSDDVKSLIDKVVKGQLKDDKISHPDSATFEQTIDEFDFDKGKVSLKVQAQEETSVTIDIQKLKDQLLGKQESDVRALLSKIISVQSAEVTLWPFWVRSIPQNPNKVVIEVN